MNRIANKLRTNTKTAKYENLIEKVSKEFTCDIVGGNVTMFKTNENGISKATVSYTSLLDSSFTFSKNQFGRIANMIFKEIKDGVSIKSMDEILAGDNGLECYYLATEDENGEAVRTEKSKQELEAEGKTMYTVRTKIKVYINGVALNKEDLIELGFRG